MACRWQCLFCFWFKTFPLPQSSARTTFGKLCQRPIELEEFSEKGRSLIFGVTRPMLEGYRSVTILQGANIRKVEMCGSAISNGGFDGSWVGSMLEG